MARAAVIEDGVEGVAREARGEGGGEGQPRDSGPVECAAANVGDLVPAEQEPMEGAAMLKILQAIHAGGVNGQRNYSYPLEGARPTRRQREGDNRAHRMANDKRGPGLLDQWYERVHDRIEGVPTGWRGRAAVTGEVWRDGCYARAEFALDARPGAACGENAVEQEYPRAIHAIHAGGVLGHLPAGRCEGPSAIGHRPSGTCGTSQAG